MWGLGHGRFKMTLSKSRVVNTKWPWFTKPKKVPYNKTGSWNGSFPEEKKINLKSHIKIQIQKPPPRITTKKNFEVSNQSIKIWKV